MHDPAPTRLLLGLSVVYFVAYFVVAVFEMVSRLTSRNKAFENKLWPSFREAMQADIVGRRAIVGYPPLVALGVPRLEEREACVRYGQRKQTKGSKQRVRRFVLKH